MGSCVLIKYRGRIDILDSPLPGDIEDPRILEGPGGMFAVVCTRLLNFGKTPRATIFFVTLENLWKPFGFIEFPSERPQKNWMPWNSNGQINLVTDVNTWHTISVPWPLKGLCPSESQYFKSVPFDTQGWRGSTPIRSTSLGLACFVHKRHCTFWRRFMPYYEHAFCIDKKIQTSFYFRTDNYNGFTFITDFFVDSDTVTIYFGVTDCYSLKAHVPLASIINGGYIVAKGIEV